MKAPFVRAGHLLVHRFWQLSSAERRLTAQAFLLLTVTWLGLRTRGYKRVHAWLEPRAVPAGPPPAAAAQQARAVARTVGRVAARLPYISCLPRSLVLWGMLRRRGIVADLHVGVRKEGSLFKAHAWVEYEGQVLNDRVDVRHQFAAFDRSLLPPGGGL